MFEAYKHYADFQGRARRSEYWLFLLFFLIVAIVLLSVQLSAPQSGLGMLAGGLYGLFGLASLVPSLAVGVRRLHDTDRSGWLLLLGLIPLIGLILIYFYVQPGTKGANKYGADPLGQVDSEVFS